MYARPPAVRTHGSARRAFAWHPPREGAGKCRDVDEAGGRGQQSWRTYKRLKQCSRGCGYSQSPDVLRRAPSEGDD